jgi:hypothetical protein
MDINFRGLQLVTPQKSVKRIFVTARANSNRKEIEYFEDAGREVPYSNFSCDADFTPAYEPEPRDVAGEGSGEDVGEFQGRWWEFRMGEVEFLPALSC